MYQSDTIINGDCLAVLPKIPTASVNFVLTDPPYIARYQASDGRRLANDDNDAWLKPAFAELHRVLAPDRSASASMAGRTWTASWQRFAWPASGR